MLSQQEVDALLRSAIPDIEPDAAQAAEWFMSDRIVQGRLPKLEERMHLLCKEARQWLMKEYQWPATITLGTTKQVKYGMFTKETPQPTVIATFHTADRDILILEIPVPTIETFLLHYMGGSGSPMKLEGRDIGDIEETIYTSFSRKLGEWLFDFIGLPCTFRKFSYGLILKEDSEQAYYHQATLSIDAAQTLTLGVLLPWQVAKRLDNSEAETTGAFSIPQLKTMPLTGAVVLDQFKAGLAFLAELKPGLGIELPFNPNLRFDSHEIPLKHHGNLRFTQSATPAISSHEPVTTSIGLTYRVIVPHVWTLASVATELRSGIQVTKNAVELWVENRKVAEGVIRSVSTDAFVIEIVSLESRS